METEILILVRNRVPTIVNIREIITYNTDYTVRFDFDGEWDTFEHKTVYFVDETGNYTAVISSDDKCEFPLFENERRRIFIGVQAGELKTTRPCYVNVLDSIADMLNSPIPPPTPDVYAQIMSIINSLESAKLNPIAKTAAMTQPVGRDDDGRLYTAPSSGGGGSGGGIPAITEADEGRVLTASGGVAVWQDLPKYGGTYTVTPEVDTVQTLETAGKYLTNDVTVNAIPDYEVTNEAGGNTFIIGKEI